MQVLHPACGPDGTTPARRHRGAQDPLAQPVRQVPLAPRARTGSRSRWKTSSACRTWSPTWTSARSSSRTPARMARRRARERRPLRRLVPGMDRHRRLSLRVQQHRPARQPASRCEPLGADLERAASARRRRHDPLTRTGRSAWHWWDARMPAGGPVRQHHGRAVGVACGACVHPSRHPHGSLQAGRARRGRLPSRPLLLTVAVNWSGSTQTMRAAPGRQLEAPSLRTSRIFVVRWS